MHWRLEGAVLGSSLFFSVMDRVICDLPVHWWRMRKQQKYKKKCAVRTQELVLIKTESPFEAHGHTLNVRFAIRTEYREGWADGGRLLHAVEKPREPKLVTLPAVDGKGQPQPNLCIFFAYDRLLCCRLVAYFMPCFPVPASFRQWANWKAKEWRKAKTGEWTENYKWLCDHFNDNHKDSRRENLRIMKRKDDELEISQRYADAREKKKSKKSTKSKITTAAR